ncbi:MAG: hypothetical protein HOG49_08230 [Candidatus Scalindua sp.]|jgi:hypothetical protein|nr:hypothetical protein [Candidatus Scalindua sp.]
MNLSEALMDKRKRTLLFIETIESILAVELEKEDEHKEDKEDKIREEVVLNIAVFSSHSILGKYYVPLKESQTLSSDIVFKTQMKIYLRNAFNVNTITNIFNQDLSVIRLNNRKSPKQNLDHKYTPIKEYLFNNRIYHDASLECRD